jgi:uncharacterized membrane protein
VNQLGYSVYLGWFLIAGSAFSLLTIIVLLILYAFRSSALDQPYEKLSWD